MELSVRGVSHFYDGLHALDGVDLDVADDLDPFTCDATMLREALRNLLDNAVRHGGPQLSRISVRCEQTSDSVLITVSDNGTGIDADKLEAAMQRFRQVTATSASGLGVSIVDAVVRGHLGTFEMTPMNPGLRAQMRFPRGGQNPLGLVRAGTDVHPDGRFRDRWVRRK